MKRKFLSMMVAASAALFSFTGLTGCSGGGGDSLSPNGMMTVRDFLQSNKVFELYGTLEFKLDPYQALTGVNEIREVEDGDELMVLARCKMTIGKTGGVEDVVVTYVPKFANGQDDVSVLDKNLESAELHFTFTGSDQLQDQSIIYALTGDPEATALSGTVKLSLRFSNPGLGGRYETLEANVAVDDDGDAENNNEDEDTEVDQTVDGSFLVR